MRALTGYIEILLIKSRHLLKQVGGERAYQDLDEDNANVRAGRLDDVPEKVHIGIHPDADAVHEHDRQLRPRRVWAHPVREVRRG